jgi:hypothetical protein
MDHDCDCATPAVAVAIAVVVLYTDVGKCRETKLQGTVLQLPLGAPNRYWDSVDEAQKEYRIWAGVGNNQQGGGWGVNKANPKPGTSKAGPKHDLLCSKHKKPKTDMMKERQSTMLGTGCRWHLTLELTSAQKAR